MLLTLEVISANGDLLGSGRAKSIGPEGAKIGRALDNDWVINDKYISRLHAQVRYVNGAFYIEGLGRNPLALNDTAHTIPNSEPQILRNGDRIFLDEYEIRVTIGAGAATGPIHGDPFGAEQTAHIPGPAKAWDMGDMGIVDAGSVDVGMADASSLDPLAALGGPAPRKQSPLPPVNIHQGSILENSYRAPSPMAPPVSPPAGGSAGGGNKIPDSWDRSGFTQMGEPQKAAVPPPRRSAPPPQAPGNAIPDAWEKARMTRIDAPAPTPMPLRPEPVGQRTDHEASQTTAPNPGRNTLDRSRQAAPPVTMHRQEPPPAPAVRAPIERPVAAAPASAATAGAFSLEELLSAAGVPATNMNTEMAAELGQVLRIVVHGLMEVLQSRAEIKSQLRMSMTRMQASENNPLKFSPNVEAALHTLLVERNRGYLPTTRAFQEALTDIRNHQIAVLQGIRSAFDAMLENFDPQKLEEDLERQSKRGGLLNLGGKGRFRDYYVELFASMTKDPDESFKRLFGESFAQAYEEQMDRLKAAERMLGE
ncbi:MAG TPA: type VI secretion system-associated FHA domain protein TagH [Steroidobacteraceae bacterium]